ncbi:MAG: hypothetical protein R3F45_05240 [Gammaproteobacteria bacterium]
MGKALRTAEFGADPWAQDTGMMQMRPPSPVQVAAMNGAAEIVADAMAGQMERFDLFAKVPHRRFPFGQRLGGSLVALGMLSYRVKDLL